MQTKLQDLIHSPSLSTETLKALFDSDPESFPKAAAEIKATVLATMVGNVDAVQFLLDHEAFDSFPLWRDFVDNHLENLTPASYECLEILAFTLPPNVSNIRALFLKHPAFKHVLSGASVKALTALYHYSVRKWHSDSARACLLEAGAIQNCFDNVKPHNVDFKTPVSHYCAAWGDVGGWSDLPDGMRFMESPEAISINVFWEDDERYTIKAPRNSTPLDIAKQALKVAKKAATTPDVEKWIANLDDLILKYNKELPTEPIPPLYMKALWSTKSATKKFKGVHGDVVSDGHEKGTIILNASNSHGLLVRTEAREIKWMTTFFPVPKKPKAKPSAGDIKKLIAQFDKANPAITAFKVKFSPEGFSLLLWKILADPTQNYLHWSMEIQSLIGTNLLPTDEATMLSAFEALGKGGIFDGSGPGIQRLFGKIGADWIHDCASILPLEKQLAYAICFPDKEPETLRPWLLETIAEGNWKISGWNRSDVGELMRLFKIGHDELPVRDMLASKTAVDVAEWAPLLVSLPKDELLKLIQNPSSKMGYAFKSLFLAKRREETGDTWEDTVALVEAARKRFPKQNHWGSLAYSSAGVIPDWVIADIPSTNSLSDLSAFSKEQLNELAETKAAKDLEFRMLVKGEEVDVYTEKHFLSPRFPESKEAYLACLERTFRSALEDSKRTDFESKDEKHKSYDRLSTVARQYGECLVTKGESLDEYCFSILLPHLYAHLDVAGRRSIMFRMANNAMLGMSREQLEIYYSQWSFEVASQEDFFEIFNSTLLQHPPEVVWFNLHGATNLDLRHPNAL